MVDYNQKGITAKFMANLADSNPSTISRAISTKHLSPLPNSSRRNARFSISDVRHVLKEFIKDKHPVSPDKKVVAFYNFKGGTGKTTLTHQVSSHLALCGYKVLVVDVDQQSNTTFTFGVEDNQSLPTLYDVITQNYDIKDVIIPIYEGLDLIPGNFSLVHLEKSLDKETSREKVFKRYFESIINDYDYIMIDCNPSVSLINRNVLTLCGLLNVVTTCHPYSLAAIPVLMADAAQYFSVLDIDLPEIFIIPNNYEDRSSTSAEGIAFLNTHYGEFLEPNFAIRKTEDFVRAPAENLPLSFFCKSNSLAFEDLSDLVKIIIRKTEASKELFKSAA